MLRQLLEALRRRWSKHQDQTDDEQLFEGWLWVVGDKEMDAEEIYPDHRVNFTTGSEIFYFLLPGSGKIKIPREKRISYSEYLRRCEELRQAEEAKKQARAS